MVQVLFVHGMGRSTLSGWPLRARLARRGVTTHAFGYVTAFQSFNRIRDRLTQRVAMLASQGEYVVIGHSLGGVLLRAALAQLPPGTREPRQLFLLGSPVRPALLAQRLQHNRLYRLLAGDCGQLLASAERMHAVPQAGVPTISIGGIRGWRGRLNPFGGLDGSPNDGIVSLEEIRAPWIAEALQVETVHTTLPSSRKVSDLILARL